MDKMSDRKEKTLDSNSKFDVDENDNNPATCLDDVKQGAWELNKELAHDLHELQEHEKLKGDVVHCGVDTAVNNDLGAEIFEKYSIPTDIHINNESLESDIEIVDCNMKPCALELRKRQRTRFEKSDSCNMSKEKEFDCDSLEGLHFGHMVENIYFLDEDELKEEHEKGKQKAELLTDLKFGREQEIPEVKEVDNKEKHFDSTKLQGSGNGAAKSHSECETGVSASPGNLFIYFPDELIVKIFSYLTTQQLCRHAMPVCKKWRQIAKEPSLWKSIDFNFNPQMESLNFLWILRKAPLLRKLVLRGRTNITHAEVAILSEMCPMLTDLDLGFCDALNGEMIQSLVENCHGLEKINVEGCDKVDHNCIKCLSKCKKLSHLNFSHCFLQDESVIYLADHLPRIVSLNVDGISWITDRGVSSLVSKHHEHLLKLELDGAEITDAAIRNISTCKKLQSLEISFCEYLSDDSLLFLKNLEDLKVLKLRKGSSFTKQGMSNFFSTATLSQLESLNLSECTCIDDSVVLDIAKCCGSHLTFLSLCWCWFITDTGLISILDHCGKLETLELLGIDKITGMCLDRVPEEIPNLTFLDLRQCNKIVDSLIMDMIRRKPDLKVMNYYGEEFVHQGAEHYM